MNIEIDSFENVELPTKSEDYPSDWYARRDTIYRQGEFLVGNWGRPSDNICSSIYSKPVRISEIKKISVVGRCEDATEIIQILF